MHRSSHGVLFLCTGNSARFQSGAALATKGGVLVEGLVVLPVVPIVRHSQGWCERGLA